MKKTTKIALGAAAPLCLTAFAAGELYRCVFVRGGSPLLNPILDKPGHDKAYYTHRDAAAETVRQAPQERYTLRSKRGELLRGYYLPCGGSGGKKLAFLVHGYHAEYAENAGMYLDYYASRGFDIFTCDNTAHGESEGRYIGFGSFEAEDCLDWLAFLRERFGDDTQIVLHGFSLGASTVLLMSDRCPDSVKCVVEDSGYADARLRLGGQLGPLLRPMQAAHRLLSGCDLAEADTRSHLERASVPILFVHGEADTMVPFENAPALYALYQGDKDFLFTPGVKHIETMHIAPEAYRAKLDAFLGKYIE